MRAEVAGTSDAESGGAPPRKSAQTGDQRPVRADRKVLVRTLANYAETCRLGPIAPTASETSGFSHRLGQHRPNASMPAYNLRYAGSG